MIAAGIVLTGGSSKMNGVIPLAEEIFRMPVRLGVPQYVSGLTDVMNNPIHATGVGLLLYSHLQQRDNVSHDPNVSSDRANVWHRMKHWFGKHF